MGGHNRWMEASREDITFEIAAVAARLVAEDGLEYAAAKRQAVKQLGLPSRTALPDNATLEAAVREHIDIFCADTQPGELLALRELLLAEGIPVDLEGRLPLARFRWRPPHPWEEGCSWEEGSAEASPLS